MTQAIDASLARLFGSGPGDRLSPVGAGFLVAPRTVCTCAHVVASALGVDGTGPRPDTPVRMDFPQLAPGRAVRGRVTAWRALGPDGEGDVAVLTLLDEPPAEAAPVPLADARDLWEHGFAAPGFPTGRDRAVWATGVIRGRHGPGLVQIEGQGATGYRVEEGFSGGPVWDERLEAVVGMVAAVDWVPEPKVGFMIPVRVLLEVSPELAPAVLRPRDTRPVGPAGVPGPPPHLLARDATLRCVREALLSLAARRSGADGLVGVHGMPGAGKSVVAAMVARGDSAVRDAFPGGIHWVEVGRSAAILPLQVKLLAALGEATAGILSEPQAAEQMSRALADRRTLLVLDDVWTAEQARAFGTPGPGAAVLLTTRARGVLATLGAQACEVATLEPGEALPLLAAWAGVEPGALPPEADEVMRECGYLALAVAMVGATVRGRPGRWAAIRERLAAADLAALARQFPGYPYPSVIAAIDASVEALPEPARHRFLDLAVFPVDTPVPEAALLALWGSDGVGRWEVLETVDAFVDASLAQLDVHGLRLHDLLADYVRARVGTAGLPELHGRLLAAYRTRCPDGWASGPNDGYFFRHLGHHLLAAGRRDELHALLDEETPDGGNRWFEAREAVDDVSGYVADVELAWRDAEAAFGTGTAGDAAVLAREARCALVLASLHAVAGGIPLELLLAVARQGVWPAPRCVAYARRIVQALQRASALGALLPMAPPSGRADLLADARAALQDTDPDDRPSERAAALAVVVAGVSAYDAGEAVRVALEETRPRPGLTREQACVALAQVAGEAPASVRGTLLEALAERLEAREAGAGRRPFMIADSLELLPAGSLGERFRPLLLEALSGIHQYRQMREVFSTRLLQVAPHLPADERDRALDDALETLAGAPANWADTFPEYARRLGPEYAGRLWEAAERIEFDYSAAIARARLIAFFPPDQRQVAASRALAELERKRGSLDATDSLSRESLDLEACRLAPYLPRPVRAELAERARDVTDERRRVEALAALAAAATGAERIALAREALDAVARVEIPRHRREALAAVVPVLPAELLPSALRVARQTHDAEHRFWYLHGLVSSARPADRVRIVRWILRMTWERLEKWNAGDTLAHLQPVLPEELVPEVLEMAHRLAAPRIRAEALAALVPLLAGPEAGAVLEEARVAARVCAGYDRAHALAAVLAATPAPQRAAHAREALAAAEEVWPHESRAEIVARLAPSLPDEQREALLARTLASAWEARNEYVVLQNVAPHLSLEQCRAVSEDVQEWGDTYEMGECAPAIAARLAALGEVGEALKLAGERFSRPLADVLVKVTPHAGPPEVERIDHEADRLDAFARERVLGALLPRMAELGGAERALALADGMQRGEPLARALSGIAPHVASPRRTALLGRAVDALAGTNLRNLLSSTLGALSDALASLPRGEAHALLCRFWRVHASQERSGFYAAVNAMAPVLGALAGPGAPGDAWDEMERVSRWWP